MNLDEYLALSAARAQEAKALMIKALDGQLPAGYVLSDDPGQMFGNALFRVKPERIVEGSRSIHFFHSLNYKSQQVDGKGMITPTAESVHVSCDVHNGREWDADVEWGVDGKIKCTLFSNDDLIASVRDAVSATLTQKPFTEFEWKRDEHDTSKYRLYGGGDKSSLGAVWKSGNGMWGSTPGIHYETLGKAKVMVEGAAIGMIRSRHDERLAGLGDVAVANKREMIMEKTNTKSVSPEFMDAVKNLVVVNEDFAAGRISSFEHSRMRETGLSNALLAMGADFGVKLQLPVQIDSRGEFYLVACPSDGSSPEYGCGKFGQEFADALNQFGVRTGIPGPNPMHEGDGWCMMNHFAAEKMVMAYAEKALQAVTYVVKDDHTLGYIFEAQPNLMGVLGSNKEGHHPHGGPVSIFGANIRPATEEDFATFRVVVPPDYQQQKALNLLAAVNAEKVEALQSDVEQSSQIGSGKWYVQSGYDDHVYSGPYDTEKEAQHEIDTDPEQAGGVPCQVEDPELSTALNAGKFADYVNAFAAERQFSVSDEEIDEVMGGRDLPPVAGALEGKVLALAEFDDVGVVFQSKGRGEARVFLADTLSRVPAVGEMMKVEWKDGKGVVLPLVAEKVLGR